MSEIQYFGTGRRKESVARVRLLPGSGRIIINGKPMDQYFGLETLKLTVRQPLVATGTLDRFDVIARFKAEASPARPVPSARIARALLQSNSEYRSVLKKSGFLTRDPRMKERKKYGLKKARRAPQFSKR